MEGKKYPLEAHFVHFNGNYPTVTQALAGAGPSALLVVGVMFQLGDRDARFVSAVAAEAATAKLVPADMQQKVNLSTVFEIVPTGNFYSYGGGLTTPPCIQVVTWINMDTPLTVTAATLNLFKSAMTIPPLRTAAAKFGVQNTLAEPIARQGNFRPLQAIGARTVYHSKGVGSNCTVSAANFDSVWTCPTGPPWSGGNTTVRTVTGAGLMALPLLWLHGLLAFSVVAFVSV